MSDLVPFAEGFKAPIGSVTHIRALTMYDVDWETTPGSSQSAQVLEAEMRPVGLLSQRFLARMFSTGG